MNPTNLLTKAKAMYPEYNVSHVSSPTTPERGDGKINENCTQVMLHLTTNSDGSTFRQAICVPVNELMEVRV